jgi:hypothetical protein
MGVGSKAYSLMRRAMEKGYLVGGESEEFNKYAGVKLSHIVNAQFV